MKRRWTRKGWKWRLGSRYPLPAASVYSSNTRRKRETQCKRGYKIVCDVSWMLFMEMRWEQMLKTHLPPVLTGWSALPGTWSCGIKIKESSKQRISWVRKSSMTFHRETRLCFIQTITKGWQSSGSIISYQFHSFVMINRCAMMWKQTQVRLWYKILPHPEKHYSSSPIYISSWLESGLMQTFRSCLSDSSSSSSSFWLSADW